jgi:hypothetical protein
LGFGRPGASGTGAPNAPAILTGAFHQKRLLTLGSNTDGPIHLKRRACARRLAIITKNRKKLGSVIKL